MSFDLRLGDCLDPVGGLASLGPASVDVAITDPVWPNRPVDMWPEVDADAVFGAAAAQLGRVVRRRLIVTLGSDTDPRFLRHVPASLPFVRICWLRYALPSYNGTVLNGGVVAYVFGDSRGPQGATLLPGEKTASSNGVPPGGGLSVHPCPRKLEHLEWLVRYFTDHGELVTDPFSGSGTTGAAALKLGRRFIGWERDPVYYADALKTLGACREQLDLLAPRKRRRERTGSLL